MAERNYKLMLLEEAELFLASLPEDVRKKIAYNIRKKTQKTPPKEIAKAEEIKRKYFELKEQKRWKK